MSLCVCAESWSCLFMHSPGSVCLCTVLCSVCLCTVLCVCVCAESCVCVFVQRERESFYCSPFRMFHFHLSVLKMTRVQMNGDLQSMCVCVCVCVREREWGSV